MSLLCGTVCVPKGDDTDGEAHIWDIMFHDNEDTMIKDKKNNKSILDRLAYAYIRKIRKWMFCPVCHDGKMTINKDSTVWTCEKCGYENDTSFSNVKGVCSDCGKIIPDPEATLCIDCRQSRKEKTKQRLINAAKIVGTVAAVASVAYLASQPSDEDENNNYTPLSGDDEEGFSMKCANCGNTNESTLWDEDDTIYCSVCHHRTNKENGEEDLVECPYCHRMRDRKAYYCRYCNDSTWRQSSSKEFKEIDNDLKEMGY